VLKANHWYWFLGNVSQPALSCFRHLVEGKAIFCIDVLSENQAQFHPLKGPLDLSEIDGEWVDLGEVGDSPKNSGQCALLYTGVYATFRDLPTRSSVRIDMSEQYQVSVKEPSGEACTVPKHLLRLAYPEWFALSQPYSELMTRSIGSSAIVVGSIHAGAIFGGTDPSPVATDKLLFDIPRRRLVRETILRDLVNQGGEP